MAQFAHFTYSTFTDAQADESLGFVASRIPLVDWRQIQIENLLMADVDIDVIKARVFRRLHHCRERKVIIND